MKMNDPNIRQKLQEYAAIIHWLKENAQPLDFSNIVGDYAEMLTCETLHLELVENRSNKGFDATQEKDGKTIHIQIKGRRPKKDTSFQFDLFHKDDDGNLEFDYLIGVVFDEFFNVKEAYRVSAHFVKQYGTWNQRRNGYILSMTDETRKALKKSSEAEDITANYRAYLKETQDVQS